jgi:hypothetical protein
MKSIVAGLAVAALALSPAAFAQATCTDIDRLLYESELDFEDIAGEAFDVDYYDATFVLPGAELCEIDLEWDAIYICFWRFSSEWAAVEFVDRQTSAMRSCLDSAWTQSVIGPNDEDNEWRLLKGASFEGDDEYIDLYFDVRADTTVENGQNVYEVELSLTYLYF